MEARFINRYTSNDKMLKEYINKVLLRKINIVGITIAVIGAVNTALSLYRADDFWVGLYGGCTLVCLLTLIISPWLSLRQFKETERRIHNGKKYETEIRFGDKIEIEEGTFSLTLEHSQITDIYFLKNIIVFKFGKQNSIILVPDGFVKGTLDEFCEYISSEYAGKIKGSIKNLKTAGEK